MRNFKTRLLAACWLAVLSPAAGAEVPIDARTASGATATLVAPEAVRAVLTKYLDLSLPLAGDDTQAVLSRRAGSEAGDLLATEGYFTPRIEVRRTTDDGLVVEVDPGPRTRVESVVIEFQGELADADAERAARRERLRADWPLKAGAAFRSADWTAAKSALLATVAAADHAGARLVDSRAEVDPAQATARLQVVIDAGPAYRFGPLAIEGLKRYDASLVQGLLLKIVLFAAAVGIAPATLVLDPAQRVASGSDMRITARLFLMLALIEAAALMLLHF